MKITAVELNSYLIVSCDLEFSKCFHIKCLIRCYNNDDVRTGIIIVIFM